MARIFLGRDLVLASHNRGKAQELLDLLQPLGLVVRLASDLHLPEPEETEDSYIGNACLKALHAAKASHLPALADDSGLSVHALDGAPGIYSARWAGPDKNFDQAMEKVLALLVDKTDRSADFVCALALAWPDGHLEYVEGKAPGQILAGKRGNQGFGYDPIFLPKGQNKSFGEMSWAEKKPLTHRFVAFQRLKNRCFLDISTEQA